MLQSTRDRSPCEPRAAGAEPVMSTGRPSRVSTGWDRPSVSHTAEPPVPTLSAMVASCANVSGEATHTALPMLAGSMRAYISIAFSHTIWLFAAALWPDRFDTTISAVLAEFRPPRG